MLGLLGMGALAACTDGAAHTAAPSSHLERGPVRTATPQTPSRPPQPPPDQLYYGASTPRTSWLPFEDELGTRWRATGPSSSLWEVPALVAQAHSDIGAGRVPLASIKPPGSWAETAATPLGWTR